MSGIRPPGSGNNFFHYIISEIVHNETINCLRHDFKSFFVFDMSFKFVTTMIPRSNQDAAYV